ncbi:hypothetical protein APHWI1_0377 [Anaplasma phagocytophilum str. ApWI1]|uniref:Uncharacterized protein n=1 Tax=Anaplasma phagocytophilum str. ApWI1 TaxID=1359155 RepID=A0A0F3PYL7_ANAPH|nr:hypothetical protein APHWEB_1139 [Anaplasma phagocytophilum str. Webster]KJV83222.1 hypothetical protein APHHGE2_1173 [Anaplasma phagocytophilum str. HGE2]KJV85062.1 hypothetical protein APHWI1_0377 [Anaplasma phagocytophilum str. ApWI1]KJV86954.1 hypothetical protein APHNYW_0886 [Anaplasma phagocytophilum str. ApNYW]KJV98221.1 hypothetical protein OTSANNIE_1145 [Anaplasma phagocytophilum str. Annie]KJZ98937.1 hypothetical protein APHCR_0371 [Anaplasma phagocytophilum str. CR1007]KKA00448.
MLSQFMLDGQACRRVCLWYFENYREHEVAVCVVFYRSAAPL